MTDRVANDHAGGTIGLGYRDDVQGRRTVGERHRVAEPAQRVSEGCDRRIQSPGHRHATQRVESCNDTPACQWREGYRQSTAHITEFARCERRELAKGHGFMYDHNVRWGAVARVPRPDSGGQRKAVNAVARNGIGKQSDRHIRMLLSMLTRLQTPRRWFVDNDSPMSADVRYGHVVSRHRTVRNRVSLVVLCAMATACSTASAQLAYGFTDDVEAGSEAMSRSSGNGSAGALTLGMPRQFRAAGNVAEQVRSAEQVDDDRAPVSLAFAGDTSFHNGLHLQDPLGAARPLLPLTDFAIINLETAIAPPDVGQIPVRKDFLFRSDPVSVEQLADTGIDAVTLANNHALDFGPAALAHGLDVLADAGIDVVGGGVDADAAYAPLVTEVGDWSVGIAAFSGVPCDWSWQGENVRPEVAWVCPAFVDRASAVVERLVDEVDLAVVMVHGGTEGQLCPDPEMRALNRRWADLGAGLVVNSHPHVVQGITSIGETIVVQSTGNFAFPPSTGLTANSALFIATLSEQGLFLSIEPFVSEGGVLQAGSDLRRRSILDQIDRYSSGWRILDDGRAVQDTSWPGLCVG